MSQSPTILSIILGVSALLAVYLAAWAHVHSRVLAAREFFFLMLGVAIYSLGYSISISRTTLEDVFQVIHFEYIGLAFIPTLLLLFALHFIRRKPLPKALTVLLLVIPMITIIMVFTTPSHQFHYIHPRLVNIGSFPVFAFDPGPWYKINSVWTELTIISAFLLLLVNAVRAPLKQKRQAITIAVGAFLPILSSLLYFLDLIPGKPGKIEPTSFSMAVTGVFFAFALFKLGLFELVPAARELALDSIRDGFLVLDRHEHVQDLNQAALRLPGAMDFRIGSPLPEGNSLVEQLTPLLTKEVDQLDFSVELPDHSIQFYHAKAYPIQSTTRRNNGTAILIYDVTETVGLVKKLNQQANTDELTGIFNRRYLIQLGIQELKRARRDRTPLGIMMMDLDHFKYINDIHGHLAGDEVLRSTAQCFQSGLRDDDILGRYGGEEFVALLPGADLPAVIQIAERLRQQIGTLAIPFGEKNITVTASFGVHAFCSNQETSLDELFNIADQALYKAKSSGRNRVVSLTQTECDAEPETVQ
jgi:diguanylate cyclase (GGDEF)-like protein